MKNQIKNRITKIMAVATVTAMVMATCVACGNADKAASNNAVSGANVSENAALVTYEFETYDNQKIVLDASNIITQEPSDDPQNSELIPAEAASNVIAPGRDYVYFADDNHYYVADLSRNLVTVADKSKVQPVEAQQETASVAGTYTHTYTEEMEGSELEFTETVVLKDDNTCEVTFQDTISGTYTEDKITLDDGSTFEYKVNGNTLELNRDGVVVSFTK